jgi:hypothetical protein
VHTGRGADSAAPLPIASGRRCTLLAAVQLHATPPRHGSSLCRACIPNPWRASASRRTVDEPVSRLPTQLLPSNMPAHSVTVTCGCGLFHVSVHHPHTSSL